MTTVTATPDVTIPETAAADVEFISATHSNPSTELKPLGTFNIDLEFFRTYVRALEDSGFDYTLQGYSSSHSDSFVMASAVGQLTERIKPIVALRPNTTFPTVAAQKLSTLDQLTSGRAVVHLISGGSDAEQARQGDYLPKDRRYARTSEYIDILRRSWTSTAPFDHDGEFYKFEGFGPGFATYSGDPIPISIGGQSDAAFEVGGAKADIFSFWGEPLDDLTSEIDRVNGIALAAGRTTMPRIWVTFRPIIAPTDKLAWEKARHYIGQIASTFQSGKFHPGFRPDAPQNVGSQRALAFASKSELYDRALWTKTAAVTNAGGASTALVGSPETVAAAILDYIDRGASLVSIRGYDTLADVRDYGRHLLPLIKQELAHRKATGQRGTLQSQHLGNYHPDYAGYATAD
jgi:alkanesulfonate monooxygenase